MGKPVTTPVKTRGSAITEGSRVSAAHYRLSGKISAGASGGGAIGEIWPPSYDFIISKKELMFMLYSHYSLNYNSTRVRWLVTSLLILRPRYTYL